MINPSLFFLANNKHSRIEHFARIYVINFLRYYLSIMLCSKINYKKSKWKKKTKCHNFNTQDFYNLCSKLQNTLTLKNVRRNFSGSLKIKLKTTIFFCCCVIVVVLCSKMMRCRIESGVVPRIFLFISFAQ